VLVLALVIASGVAGVLWRCGGDWRRALWIGGPLLQVQLPVEGSSVPQGGLPVRVTYPDADRVVSETFRCELNGQDVTSRVAVRARNGADGAVFPMREGVNRLRIGVFGRGLWGNFVEDVVELEVRARPLGSWDRA